MEILARIKRSIMYDVQPLRTKSEIKQVGNLLKQNRYGQRDYMIFYMGINTGLRMSDITSFKIKDVANGKNPTVLELKTRKKRKINMVNIRPELDAYIAYLRSQGFTAENNDWLFPSQKQAQINHKVNYTDANRAIEKHPVGRISPHAVYQIFQKVAQQLGRSDIGTHTCRKTYGYWFYKQTHDIGTLMQLFNHSDEGTTKRYIGISDEELMNAQASFHLEA